MTYLKLAQCTVNVKNSDFCIRVLDAGLILRTGPPSGHRAQNQARAAGLPALMLVSPREKMEGGREGAEGGGSQPGSGATLSMAGGGESLAGFAGRKKGMLGAEGRS